MGTAITYHLYRCVKRSNIVEMVHGITIPAQYAMGMVIALKDDEELPNGMAKDFEYIGPIEQEKWEPVEAG